MKAAHTLNVDGGTGTDGYGLMLTPLIYGDSQGRLVNGSGFYINGDGEYVGADGVKLAVDAAPVLSDAAPESLSRVSGGTLETAAHGVINISADRLKLDVVKFGFTGATGGYLAAIFTGTKTGITAAITFKNGGVIRQVTV